MFARPSRLSIALTLLALTWISPAYSHSADGRFFGRVKAFSKITMDGDGLTGVTLTVKDQGTGAVISTTTSGEDGSYKITVAPGVYSLTASFQGFEQQMRGNLRVDEGASVAVDFTLKRTTK